MTRELREQLVLDLLQDAWTPANTAGVTPNITFGWYDQKEEGTPLLTVGESEESPSGGGATGYDSMDGAGGGPEQTMDGSVPVNVWTHRGDLDSASTSSQREYNGLAVEEVARIVRANAVRPTNPRTGEQPVRLIGVGVAQAVPEPNEHAVYRKQIPVPYRYHTNG